MSAAITRRCTECGGARATGRRAAVVAGCRDCCRDCGFQCGRRKDDEGFHLVKIDEAYLEERRVAESFAHERVVLVRVDKEE